MPNSSLLQKLEATFALWMIFCSGDRRCRDRNLRYIFAQQRSLAFPSSLESRRCTCLLRRCPARRRHILPGVFASIWSVSLQNKESVEHLLRVQCGRALLSQPGLSRIGHHDQSSAHHDSILNYQPSSPAQERKTVVDVAERRYPARRRRDEKRERYERHHKYQESTQRCYLRKPRVEACILRSGMTSRSKCASFSISQMSWSRAGPRRPAVIIFVLSGTGAPVALVKRSGFDIMNSQFPGFCYCKLDI